MSDEDDPHPSDHRWRLESPVEVRMEIIEPPEMTDKQRKKAKKKRKNRRKVPFGFARALKDKP